MLYSDILNAINLFLYHKQMTSESLRNGEILHVLDLSLH